MEVRGASDIDRMLAILLADDILLIHDLQPSDLDEKPTVALSVICSDIFAWGCCDDEELLSKEIPALYQQHSADKKWGAIKWCCIRRNQKPQAPVIRGMKQDGIWDDTMENLLENEYDKRRGVRMLSRTEVN